MGQMINGVWHAGWYAPDASGAFRRPATVFRARVSADDPAGFRAEAGRYHLYASFACPWAHRTLITRALRGLESAIPVTIVDPKMGDDGWQFADTAPDPILGARYLRDIYTRARADYTGRVTVPILWDKQTGTIVNNESRDLMRMLDTEFEAFASNGTTLVPADLRSEIDATLDAIYEPINNGVYRAGFAGRQSAYEAACTELFAALDHWETVLGGRRYLCGDRLTEADIALFTTMARFDLVYYAHFKCNVRRLQDYPNLWSFTRDVYQTPGVAPTCEFGEIKTHYYWSQTTVNPSRVIPLGPSVDFTAPHDRARMRTG